MSPDPKVELCLYWIGMLREKSTLECLDNNGLHRNYWQMLAVYGRCFLFLLIIVFGSPALSKEWAVVTGATIDQHKQGEVLRLGFSGKVVPSIFTLPNPERLVVDLPGVQPGVLTRLITAIRSPMVARARYGRHEGKQLRLVLELAQPMQAGNWQLQRQPDGQWRLQVPLSRKGSRITKPVGATQTVYTQRLVKPRRIAGVPVPFPRVMLRQSVAVSDRPAPLTALHNMASVGQKPKHSAGIQETKRVNSWSLGGTRPSITALPSRGRTQPLIVVDAGHGGKDPGATGKVGTREKDVTLRYAYALHDALRKTGRYRVLLTRKGDYIVSLRKRFAMAREAGAALFISLHADAAQNHKARGLSVYTLSETASDEEAAALAAQENKADIIAGIDLSVESQDVADILIDLAQRETKNQSIDFAHYLLDSMQGITLLQNPHRQAGFAVLKAPDIPSVLVEMGFLTNRHDEQLLRSSAYQRKFAENMRRGIDLYFANYPATHISANE